MTGMQIACDPKHNKINFTGNRYLSEILSQQKQFCPLVRPGPNPSFPGSLKKLSMEHLPVTELDENRR